MQLDALVRRNVDTARAEETALAAAQRMAARNVGTLVVVGTDGRPAGIVTDRDLVTRVTAQRRDAADVTVGEVMTRPPQTIFFAAPVEAALLKMELGGYRRLAVVDGDGALAGIVALDDVLRALVGTLGCVGRVLAGQVPECVACAPGDPAHSAIAWEP